MNEPEVHSLPPWPKQRRVKASLISTGYILLAAAFIGTGIYQIGIQREWIRRPINKETITQSLLQDAAFLHAAQHAGNLRTCTNTAKGFSLRYQAPLHPLQGKPEAEACQHFVALHPTGADIFVDIENVRDSREHLMLLFAKEYDYIQTDILTGTRYQVGRLSGLKKGVDTITYVIGTDISESWVVIYKLTSPTLNDIVQELVISFNLD